MATAVSRAVQGVGDGTVSSHREVCEISDGTISPGTAYPKVLDTFFKAGTVFYIFYISLKPRI